MISQWILLMASVCNQELSWVPNVNEASVSWFSFSFSYLFIATNKPIQDFDTFKCEHVQPSLSDFRQR